MGRFRLKAALYNRLFHKPSQSGYLHNAFIGKQPIGLFHLIYIYIYIYTCYIVTWQNISVNLVIILIT
jgi:hypothetical protein